jgi:hypothetical protein
MNAGGREAARGDLLVDQGIRSGEIADAGSLPIAAFPPSQLNLPNVSWKTCLFWQSIAPFGSHVNASQRELRSMGREAMNVGLRWFDCWEIVQSIAKEARDPA